MSSDHPDRLDNGGLPPRRNATARFTGVRLRRQLKATARFAELALKTNAALGDVLQAGCQAACEGSGIAYSKVLIPDATHGDLVIRAGVGWHGGVIGMRVPATARTAPGATLLSGRPLVVADLYADGRFDVHEPLKSHGIVSVANVPIMLGDAVLGVLELDSPRPIVHALDPSRPVALDSEDLDFLQALVAPIAAAMLRVDFERTAMRTEQRLRQREKRLRVALEAARTGTWFWRPSPPQLVLDDNLRRLMALAPGQTVERFEDFSVVIHPLDRAAVGAAFTRALHERGRLEVDMRIVHPGGSIRWLHTQGCVLTDHAGQPDGMAGVCMDITERRQAELERQQEDQSKI